ncbi:mitochondrial 2-oxodicarboxylate carrier isoform X7 [Acinonyx jubatus]|uniref:Mitochondrial 2-oxodicarboxylate carrier isoform X7 n=1 Tax=Acinonyx jubatus TaxID=32536 RepID=A0ABM3Q8W5_ACIJB|nr:mitochondrial 2-oxodicarboxylate carrier isoform X7 [Acinonyx jubatus]XP_053080357.1 mitochondrial 2-oxodicarboxylate carrier isoform X7 [Acinonyx jubatus]
MGFAFSFLLPTISGQLTPKNVSTCPFFRTSQCACLPGGQGSPQPRQLGRRRFFTCVIRGSTSSLTNRRRLPIGKRVGANLGDQTRLTAAASPTPSASLFSPEVLRGAQEAYQRRESAPERVQRAGSDPRHITRWRVCALSLHLRAVAGLQPHSAQGTAQPRLSRLGEAVQVGSEAGELAHSSRPTPSSWAFEDVRQARGRLRERGFSPDPGRWFRCPVKNHSYQRSQKGRRVIQNPEEHQGLIQVKKYNLRPILTMCQQLGIATHSFKLSSLRGKKSTRSQ